MKTIRPELLLLERNGPVVRFMAALMLAIFLPAVVIAAPLRICTGPNGHRAIEFVHAKEGLHANRQATFRSSLLEALHAVPYVLGQHCQDKLLLPIVAKPEKRDLWAPSHSAVLRPDARLSPATCTRRETNSRVYAAATRQRRTDPRLRTHRTVVLLN